MPGMAVGVRWNRCQAGLRRSSRRVGKASAMSNEPHLNLVGERIALGPISREMFPSFLRWMNDFEITRNLGAGMKPLTAEMEEAWYGRVATSEGDRIFAIYEREAKALVGSCGLHG